MANTPILKGATFSICATAQADELNQAAFDALTFLDCGKIVEHGNLEVTENDVSQGYWGGGWLQHQKGQKDGGTTSITIGYDPDSTGADALDTAAATELNYAFKIDIGDNPGGTTNTILYYRGLIALPSYQLGNNEAFLNKTFAMMLNQGVIQVDPTSV